MYSILYEYVRAVFSISMHSFFNLRTILVHYVTLAHILYAVYLFAPGRNASNMSAHPVNAVTTSPGASVLSTLVTRSTGEEAANWVELDHTLSGLDAAGRTLLALSLFLFCMRVFHFYAISRQLGPKVLMVGQMVRTLTQILNLSLLNNNIVTVYKFYILVYCTVLRKWYCTVLYSYGILRILVL